MRSLWIEYAARFEALSLRERMLITLTVLVMLVLLGYVMVIEPQQTRKRIAEQQMAQQQAELVDIQQKLAVTQAGANEQDRANRANLERAQGRIKEISSRLKSIEQALAPPDSVTPLLEEMLRRNHRVQLVSLRNLPVTDLIERKEPAATERADAAVAKAIETLKQGGVASDREKREYDFASIEGPIYKHGVEIVVSGSYADLMTYLVELEQMPQKVLWSSVKLNVEEYPRAQMTITVHTLSLDRAWLVV